MKNKIKCAVCGYEGKAIHVMDYDKEIGHVARLQTFLTADGIRLGALKACPKCGTLQIFISEEANAQLRGEKA